MQQKKTTLGVKGFQSSFKTIHSETPNHSKNNSTNISQKKNINSNQILAKAPLNYSNNQNSINFSNNENLNISNNMIKLNNIINNNLENENNNNQYHIGRWTDEEHQKFIDGILEYGNEWKKVQQIIKTRSSTQARSHAQKFFLRVKKLIKNNGGNFNINEKDKIFENIINTILPNKKGETLTKSQKEKLLSAISSNIKYEGEINERSEDELQMGLLEEENLKYKKENNENDLKQKKSADTENLPGNNFLFTQRKISIGQKRKLSKIDSRDKIFFIQKDISHKPSLDISSQKINIIENNDNSNKNNLKENNSNQNNKINDNKSNNNSNMNNNKNNLNINNANDNCENKNNNMSNCIINNYINVTNNFMNNKYICNFYSNDIINNNNQDNYNYDKNDSINIDRNMNCFGFYQCPDKSLYNIDKPFLFGNQFNKTFYNNFNFINNKVNNYNENENLNNGSNPFELNFNNFNNDNYNNNENEQQISIQEEEFIKLNNNNNNIDDNIEYN